MRQRKSRVRLEHKDAPLAKETHFTSIHIQHIPWMIPFRLENGRGKQLDNLIEKSTVCLAVNYYTLKVPFQLRTVSFDAHIRQKRVELLCNPPINLLTV